MPQLPVFLRCASATVLPPVCPPGDQSVFEKQDPPEERGQAGTRLPRVGVVVQLQGAGLQLSPRGSVERLQLPLPSLCICSITAALAPGTPLFLAGTQCLEAVLKHLPPWGCWACAKPLFSPKTLGRERSHTTAHLHRSACAV